MTEASMTIPETPDELLKWAHEVEKFAREVADGAPVDCASDFLMCDNPDFTPDNGAYPRLLLDLRHLPAIARLAAKLMKERDEVEGARIVNRNAVALQKERAEAAEAALAASRAREERLREALALCADEIEENLAFEGRLASFKAALAKARAALSLPAEAADPAGRDARRCPKCGATSGDDWRCAEGCPMPMRPALSQHGDTRC